MADVPLLFPSLVFHRCRTTPFFLVSFVPVFSPFHGESKGVVPAMSRLEKAYPG